MRIFHELIVDDYMEDTAVHFTKSHWNATIGNFETMRLFIVADRVSGTSPALFISLDETPIMDLSRLSGVTFAGLGTVPLVAGQTNTFTGAVSVSDPGMPASYALPIVYLLQGTSPKAHIRIWVTGRGRA